jgi:hypothetical protein
MIPSLLVAGLAGLGGLTQAASAHDGDRRAGPGYMRGECSGDYGWSGQRWRDDSRRFDDDRGPRWRDDDRRGYGSREGRWDDDDDDRCGPRGSRWGHGGRGYGMHHGHGMHHGYGRGYGRHDGYDRGPGHGRYGAADPAELDSIKKEIGITAAQEQGWTKYAGVLKEAADARRARRDAFREGAVRNLSPEDHRKLRDNMIEQRRKEVDAVRTAADELVKSLDEKQVAIAKEVLPGYAFGPGGAGMGWGGRHRW